MKTKSLRKLTQFILLVAFFLCIAISLSHAQKNRQVLSIGPKLGVNLSDFHGDVSNNNIQPGLSAGGILTYSVVNTFGISLEALYSQKGAKFTGVPNGTQRTDFNRRVNYVEVPVLARYFLNKNGSFRPNLFVGPDFGFTLNAKDINRKIVGGAELADDDISDAFNPVDVGVTAGIGLNYLLFGATRILFDARYTYGFSDINENALPAFVNNGKVGNAAITLTAGLSFGIGKRYEK